MLFMICSPLKPASQNVDTQNAARKLQQQGNNLHLISNVFTCVPFVYHLTLCFAYGWILVLSSEWWMFVSCLWVVSGVFLDIGLACASCLSLMFVFCLWVDSSVVCRAVDDCVLLLGGFWCCSWYWLARASCLSLIFVFCLWVDCVVGVNVLFRLAC